MKASPVAELLRARNVSFALIGGFAVIARGHARFTEDYDFVTANAAVLRNDFWGSLEQANIDVRRGDFDDPLGGVVHITLRDGTDVDVIVVKYIWQQDIIERAEHLDVGGTIVPVPTVADLILLKLFAGGPVDIQDIHALLQHSPDRNVVVGDVERDVTRLPADAQNLWATLRSA